MNTSENTTLLEHRHHPPDSQVGKLGAFLWHLFQMAVAMKLGMLLYMLLRSLLAPLGFAAVQAAYPLVDYWIMVVFMTIPMIALMRHHRYSWHGCAGMAAAMLAPLVVLCALTLPGLLTIQTLHCTGDVAMLLGMAAYLLYRRY